MAPGFTFAAAVSPAVGIGANTAIFSVIYTVLLSPPNFKYLDRLAMVVDVNGHPHDARRAPGGHPGDAALIAILAGVLAAAWLGRAIEPLLFAPAPVEAARCGPSRR